MHTRGSSRRVLVCWFLIPEKVNTRGSETRLQPIFVCVDRLHFSNIINSLLIIPISAKPPTNTSPHISCVVCEMVCPSLVASADDAIHIFGAERRIISAHRPCRFTVYVFDLEDTVTLSQA